MIPLALILALMPLATQEGHSKSGANSKEPEEHVYELADVAPPRVTRQVNPEYPDRGVRVQGVVTIGAVITSKGVPDDVKVVKSLEKDVDRCALDAVKQWRFAPAKKDGKPVAVHITIEIEFHSM
jgi:TonB family protein